jgi:hypothetical protein
MALADLAAIATAIGVDYRIVGGHMVTLLVEACGVSDRVILRETLDADFGALPEVVADPRLVRALRDRNYETPGAANRFVRRQDDEVGRLDMMIDILAPSYAGRLVSGQRYGDLVADEIPGLAFALSRPSIRVELGVRLTGRSDLSMSLVLPDLSSAICIKTLAYRGRYADKDAVDLWRLMNAAYEVGLRSNSWPVSVTGRMSADVLRRFFGRAGASGLKQLSSRRVDQARMHALVSTVVEAVNGDAT